MLATPTRDLKQRQDKPPRAKRGGIDEFLAPAHKIVTKKKGGEFVKTLKI